MQMPCHELCSVFSAEKCTPLRGKRLTSQCSRWPILPIREVNITHLFIRFFHLCSSSIIADRVMVPSILQPDTLSQYSHCRFHSSHNHQCELPYTGSEIQFNLWARAQDALGQRLRYAETRRWLPLPYCSRETADTDRASESDHESADHTMAILSIARYAYVQLMPIAQSSEIFNGISWHRKLFNSCCFS